MIEIIFTTRDSLTNELIPNPDVSVDLFDSPLNDGLPLPPPPVLTTVGMGFVEIHLDWRYIWTITISAPGYKTISQSSWWMPGQEDVHMEKLSSSLLLPLLIIGGAFIFLRGKK